MKLMYMDLLTPKGHKIQNKRYINLLAKYFDVYVTCPENWYNNSLNAHMIEDKDFLVGKGKFKNRLDSIRSFIKNYRLLKSIKPDYIFIASYDTITLAFVINFLIKKCNNRVKILHHNNIDETKNKIKRFFFKTYINKVDHIVFEEFIKEYLNKNYNIKQNSIYVLPHQLNIENNCSNNSKKEVFDCVGLSQSNDDNIIYEIIKNEIKNETIKNSNIKIILKSKLYEFDNGALKVFKGYLETKEYNNYIVNSLSFCMPFSVNFNNRMSGTFVDALSNNKVVFGTNIKLLKYYNKKYPHICNIFNNIEDLVVKLSKVDINKNQYIEEFLDFKYAHSDKVIEEVFISSVFKK